MSRRSWCFRGFPAPAEPSARADSFCGAQPLGPNAHPERVRAALELAVRMEVQGALPRVLASPPIVEALVDFRAAVIPPPEPFEALSQGLRTEYPTAKTRRGIKAELRVEQGKLIPPTAEDLGFQGVLLHNQDGTAIVQLRPDGFTFNNVPKYMGGDALLAEALRLWSRFAQD